MMAEMRLGGSVGNCTHCILFNRIKCPALCKQHTLMKIQQHRSTIQIELCGICYHLTIEYTYHLHLINVHEHSLLLQVPKPHHSSFKPNKGSLYIIFCHHNLVHIYIYIHFM